MKVIADFIEPFRQTWEAKFSKLDNILINMKKNKK